MQLQEKGGGEDVHVTVTDSVLQPGRRVPVCVHICMYDCMFTWRRVCVCTFIQACVYM